MSAGSDDIFARWARRKQAVRDTETPPDEGEGACEATEPRADAEPPPEPAEPLPRLEDLTAESDLSAFLREGVPKALKSAAIRKMWSLDPAIRDYIGPSEYAWDFNKPGSMAGFGPLDDAGEQVAAFLSTMSESARSRLAKAAASEMPQPQSVGSEEDRSGPPHDESDTDPPQVGLLETPDMPADPEPPSPGGVTATQSDDSARPAEPPGLRARSRHGRAMPR